MSQNYGLKGGELDATEHIEKARLRTCFPSEIASYRDTILPAPKSKLVEIINEARNRRS